MADREGRLVPRSQPQLVFRAKTQGSSPLTLWVNSEGVPPAEAIINTVRP